MSLGLERGLDVPCNVSAMDLVYVKALSVTAPRNGRWRNGVRIGVSDEQERRLPDFGGKA